MSEDTEIFFPDTLPYPFTVRSLLVRPGDRVETGQKVLNYGFMYHPAGPSSKPETRFGWWDSTFSGELRKWNVKVGDTITRERGERRPALQLIEPCKHGMQFNGLCALCGIDMDTVDFTSRGNASRATIQMTHSASGPTVTLEEAQKLERETAERLLKIRKLSLIVDLDQTIVHATVDPTVGEWISEGEAWEERNARRIAKREAAVAREKTPGNEDSDSDSDGDDDEDDEVNPNWEALKDVKKFRLPPDDFGAPRDFWKKNNGIQNEGCLYYVKPRPGWREFLSSVASKYEMHVYTMGTRAYAEKVCAAIDPDGSLFGGRILSRDESGSLTQKSLRRLFPCDTSMVVIIDDRADVWDWSPNLIKVIPYDFFVGIGDINSAFLPKIDPLSASLTLTKQVESSTSSNVLALDASDVPDTTASRALSPSSITSDETAVEPSDEPISNSKSEMITQNALALEAQVEERPLAKKQEQLESDDDAAEAAAAADEDTNADPTHSDAPTEDHTKTKHHRKALLKNDDIELTRIGQLLEEIHKRFFHLYDNKIPENHASKRRKSFVHTEVPYDVKYIVPSIRKETFKDVHILFSGVIPTNLKTPHEETEVWKMATAFGASCHKDLSAKVTHVVTTKNGTQKVEKARTLGGILVVWLQWFTDSVAKWQRQDESKYLLGDDHTESTIRDLVSSPPSDPNAISTDTDPEALVGDIDDDDSAENFLAASADNKDTPQAVNTEDIDDDDKLELDDVDWDNINDEVEAAMMESDEDDEDEDDEDDDTRSISSAVSDGSYTDEARSATSETKGPRLKRIRSRTPSEAGDDPDELRSRLAKRKKVAAERSGTSRLKVAVSAHDLASPVGSESAEKTSSGPGTPNQEHASTNGSMASDGEESEEELEIDDDFLARELEEELG